MEKIRSIEKGIESLSRHVTPERWQRFLDVSRERTRFVTVVLENIYQPHNASAVVRTCEAFGILDLYVIEDVNPFSPTKGITLGSEKWVEIHRFKDPDRCYRELKDRGYEVVVTVPPCTGAVSLKDFEIRSRTAIVFGTELKGVSESILKRADRLLTIPMYGFVQSLNISVACGITIFTIVERLKASNLPWRLSEEERLELLYRWLKRSVKEADLIEERSRRGSGSCSKGRNP